MSDYPMFESQITLPAKEWAARRGIAFRTVQRYLADGRIPGAAQDDNGHWMIPSEAPVVPKSQARPPVPTAAGAPATPGVRQSAPAAAGYEQPLPVVGPPPLGILGSLEEAAQALGTTVGGVRRMGRDGLLKIGPYGPNGALRVYLPPR